MAVKIRLQRHGKKGKPYYWIVAADARSKRDGKYLEKLGAYNPNTNPATIELNVDGAVTWLQNGAQPTDTARAILSYKGALLKNHLAGGVRKGALTEEQAEAKFNAWLDEKAGKVDAKKEGLAKAKADAKAKALEAEKAVNEARAAVPVEEVTEEPVAEEVTEETVAEESTEETTEVAEEATKETTVEDIVAEEPVAEEVVADEPAVEEATEEPVAEETTEDTPVVEEVAEETAEDAPETKTEASKEEE